MIVQKIPRFESGNVLSRGMLDALKQNCIAAENMNYFGYSEGIIKGFSITATEEYLLVGKGCYFFDNEIQYVTEEVKVPYVSGNSVKLLVLRTGDKEISRQFEIREAELKLITEDEKRITDIEVCRFCIQNGASLRDLARSLKDMSTFYDTVCVCYAQWAAFGEQSVAYPVLFKFASELYSCRNRTPEDNLMIGQIFASKGETLPKRCIEAYISNKLQRIIQTDTPFELYEGLCDALKAAKNNTVRAERRSFTDRKIIVD